MNDDVVFARIPHGPDTHVQIALRSYRSRVLELRLIAEGVGATAPHTCGLITLAPQAIDRLIEALIVARRRARREKVL